MDALECIATRHSYRQPFQDAPIPRTDLQRILQAGLDAPSGCNKQTTQFVAVDAPEILAKVRKVNTMPAVQTAPALIFCLTDREPGAVYNGCSFQVEDCAAAVQNMLLATHALGYASVWVQGGLSINGQAEALAAILGVPDTKRIFILLPIGVPQEEAVGPEKLPALSRVSYNSYTR